MSEKDPPIEEQPYLYGVSVIDIGDIRVSRGLSRRPFSICKHRRMVFDQHERRIWCKDCETTLDAFDAFRLLAEQSHAFLASIKDRERQVSEDEKHTTRSRAAKVLDEAWRSRSMVPACPHCRSGLFPEDFTNGVSKMGRDYAAKRRATKEPTE
jgi:hypothetical protein